MEAVDRPRDPLLMFLYILLRDLLPSGEVEGVMEQHVEKTEEMDLVRFSNPFIVAHAEDLIARLRPSAAPGSPEEAVGGLTQLQICEIGIHSLIEWARSAGRDGSLPTQRVVDKARAILGEPR